MHQKMAIDIEETCCEAKWEECRSVRQHAQRKAAQAHQAEELQLCVTLVLSNHGNALQVRWGQTWERCLLLSSTQR